MVLKRTLLSFTTIAILLMALLLSIALFAISLAKNFRIRAEIASKCEVLNRLAKESKMPLVKESVASLTDERDKLKNIYSRFELALISPLNEEIPNEELEPLLFKERLIQVQKRLRASAKRYNLSLPDSIGFTKYETKLSEPSEIPDLIKRLKVLEEVIHIMSRSGVKSLNEIHFVERDKKPRVKQSKKKGKKAEESPPLDITKQELVVYYGIPVSLKIGCTSSRLINFLHNLRISPIIFLVDDLDIEKTDAADKGMLKASLSIRAVALN